MVKTSWKQHVCVGPEGEGGKADIAHECIKI
jgi:hypothetical protein